jgi:hypothetical protein
MKKILLILFLSLLTFTNVNAAITIKDWLKVKAGEDLVMKRLHDKLVFSAFTGLMAINVQLDEKKFCQPEDLSINEQMTEAILDAGILRFKEIGVPQHEMDEFPVGFILLDQLEVMFPCK